MANNFDSNITLKLADPFLEKFESLRVMSKNVNSQLLEGEFDPSTGDTVYFRRPTDYNSSRTSDGDLTAVTDPDIITGKAPGIVQDYITVKVGFSEANQAIKMDKLDELLDPIATRIVTDLEVDYAGFMMKNAGLYAGTKGNAVASWDEAAIPGAVMASNGVPADNDWMLAVNPYTQVALAGIQRSLGGGVSDNIDISDAHRKAILSDNFAGLKVLTSPALASYSTPAGADRVGAITTIDVTYETAKDTMKQSIVVSGFQANLGVKAGDILEFTGVNRLNQSTRQPIVTAAGANVLFSGVVTADVTLSGTGTGTIVISGPAIYEINGSHNTTDVAAEATGVITLLGAASTLYQPNIFWHKNAFAIGSVPIEKLFSTDTLGTTEDGMQIRVSKGADIITNKQIVRFDLRPAYAVLNPFFAGQSFGTA